MCVFDDDPEPPEECTEGESRCAGTSMELCMANEDRETWWGDSRDCADLGSVCLVYEGDAFCSDTCVPGSSECRDRQIYRCVDASEEWQIWTYEQSCTNQGCLVEEEGGAVCVAPPDSAVPEDCRDYNDDDGDGLAHDDDPDCQLERCDGLDNNSDGIVGFGEEDSDGDGSPDCEVPTCTGMGSTWVGLRYTDYRSTDDRLIGVYEFICNERNDDGECDTSAGDTTCDQFRSVLCWRSADFPRPEASLDEHSWSEAYLAITPPIQGCRLTSPEAGDALCEAEVGWGYEMLPEGDERLLGYAGLDPIPLAVEFWVRATSGAANCWGEE